ncbi:MAG: OmpH family outer membrane protein [Planctomycetes bacterium]|nr:OmpH family outer membrane protein [Planctomycetota bacterium]
MASRFHLFSTALVMAFMASAISAQVTLKRGAVVYAGSAANTTAPATIDEKKVQEATEEWKKIEADGIDLDSARGKQLVQKMNAKVREAVKAIATDESRDLVVRKDDIIDDKGHEVVDLTDKVVKKLEDK